jgi:hypothetical protein
MYPLGIIKKIWNGFLNAIAWLTQESLPLYDIKHERLAMVKQAHFNFR